MAHSEKGFVDEPWRRFSARLPLAQSGVTLGCSADMAQLEPVRMRPLRLTAPKPDDGELVERLGRLE